MLKHTDHHVGDVWFYIEGDLAHAFYLVCPHATPPHTHWDIGHATSRDLINWEIHPLALRQGDAGSWDECLATGCVFRMNDQYAMAFTSHLKAETGLAWSRDLYAWAKDPVFPITRVDARFYELNGTGERTFRHWRDPFVLNHNGEWYQFVCASTPSAPAGGRGSVGVALLKNAQWEIQPPLNLEPFCQEMECPQIYVRGKYYYLVFSTFERFITAQQQEKFGADKLGSGTFVMVADNLLGPYHVTSQPRLLPLSLEKQPYGCQLVNFKGRDYCLGTIWESATSYISDPYPVEYSSSGIFLRE